MNIIPYAVQYLHVQTQTSEHKLIPLSHHACISVCTLCFVSTTVPKQGCQGPNPNQEIIDIERTMQTTIDNVWNQLSIVDSVGRKELAEACGGNLDELLEGARLLAVSLSSIRKALDSTVGTLDCMRIHPIYVEIVHEELCEEIGEASGLSYLIFLGMSLSLFVLITLRASWYHFIEDEVVYDEDEVADNMILDEHEEYLRYISKYKHEWQEYNGFSTTSLPRSEDGEEDGIMMDYEDRTDDEDDDNDDDTRATGGLLIQTESDVSDVYTDGGLESCSSASVSYVEDVPINNSDQDGESGDDRSQVSSDCSFASLHVPEHIKPIPPPMLPQLQHDPSFGDDEEEVDLYQPGVSAEEWKIPAARSAATDPPAPSAPPAPPVDPSSNLKQPAPLVHRRTGSDNRSFARSVLSVPTDNESAGDEEGVEISLSARHNRVPTTLNREIAVNMASAPIAGSFETEFLGEEYQNGGNNNNSSHGAASAHGQLQMYEL